MEFASLHEWPQNPNDAVKIQEALRSRVVIESRIAKIEYIAAVDTAFNDKNNRVYSAAVVMKYPELTDSEKAMAQAEVTFPYIPALLSFREGPVILKALGRLKQTPDVVIFPGHGLAHPRGFGLASHLGVLIGIPSIGCARKRLVGDYREPGAGKGSCSSIFVSNVEVGFAYRTKENVKPMFISPGHLCDIREALDIVVKCVREYRMPEPMRLAHLLANKFKNSAGRKNDSQRSDDRVKDSIDE